MRLFGVDILIPTSKTPTSPILAAHDQTKLALTLWTDPMSSSSNNSPSRKRKMSSENSLVPCTASSSSAPTSTLTLLSQENTNANLRKKPRKRKMSSKRSLVSWATSSSSAPTSTVTMSSQENTNANSGKKPRKAQPSDKEVAMANSNRPPFPTLLKFNVMSKLGNQDFKKCNPKLIFQKFMFESDIKEDQARLLIPAMQLIGKEENFLNEAEFVKLTRVGVGYIDVKVMYYKHIIGGDREVKDKDMKFSRWPKPTAGEVAKKSSVRYALQGKGRWNEVVKDIDIKVGDSIQVWAFRHPHNLVDGSLVFVLVNLGNSKKLKEKSIGN